jgi:hypothetical protein
MLSPCASTSAFTILCTMAAMAKGERQTVKSSHSSSQNEGNLRTIRGGQCMKHWL